MILLIREKDLISRLPSSFPRKHQAIILEQAFIRVTFESPLILNFIATWSGNPITRTTLISTRHRFIWTTRIVIRILVLVFSNFGWNSI